MEYRITPIIRISLLKSFDVIGKTADVSVVEIADGKYDWRMQKMDNDSGLSR